MRGANTTVTIERAVGEQLDGRNRPVIAWATVATNVPANLVVKTRRTTVVGGIADFGEGAVTTERITLLVPPGTDLRAGDRIQHDTGTYAVETVNPRRTHTGTVRHLSAELERSVVRPTPEPEDDD